MLIVFGGSFNPPTIAHLKIIETLIKTYPAADIRLLPVGNDYQKPELVPFEHRLHMLQILIQGLDRVTISNKEDITSYQGTLHSLNVLSKEDSDIYFVIGSDNLSSLDQWIDYQTLLASYPFIVMKRQQGLTEEEAETLYRHLKHQFIFIDFDVNVSSSTYRKTKKHHHVITHEVQAYIEKYHLYKEPSHV